MEVSFHFYTDERFQKDDIILVPFGEKVPSSYRVLYANKKLKKLKAVVLDDTWEKKPKKPGTVVDLSHPIYEGYWCFRLVKNIKPKGNLVVERG